MIVRIEYSETGTQKLLGVTESSVNQMNVDYETEFVYLSKCICQGEGCAHGGYYKILDIIATASIWSESACNYLIRMEIEEVDRDLVPSEIAEGLDEIIKQTRENQARRAAMGPFGGMEVMPMGGFMEWLRGAHGGSDESPPSEGGSGGFEAGGGA